MVPGGAGGILEIKSKSGLIGPAKNRGVVLMLFGKVTDEGTPHRFGGAFARGEQ